MGILEGKSWLAQDYYNEYLQLKSEISDLTEKLRYFKRGTTNPIIELQVPIDAKVERLRVVLHELQHNHGVSLVDLILLSIGVDV